MESASCTRGDFPRPIENPVTRIDRGVAEGGPRPSGPPIQSRDGFTDHRALGALTGGKPQGPTKLKTKSAQGLAVQSADHLAVKSAAHLKK